MKKFARNLLVFIFVLVQVLSFFPGIPANAADGDTITLIEGNSTWSYNDSNTDQGTAWRAEGFDDTSWKTGHGPFGYPASDSNSTFGKISDGTLVSNQSNPNAYITYYFRKSFSVADVSAISQLNMTVGLDDGYVMYINGTEIRRKYMPEGDINWQTAANYVNEPSTEQGTDAADITATALPLLKNGNNTIMVEMHNRDNNSSDIYFDMSLTAKTGGVAPTETPTTTPTVTPTATPTTTPGPAVYNASNLTMQPGSDESSMNFCWYSDPGNTASSIQIAKKSEMTGDVFPASAVTVQGTVTNVTGNVSNEVGVTGLEASTEYVYRVGNGTDYSQVYSFKTQNAGSYNAILVGDPQIGSSGNSTNDTNGWVNTVNAALNKFAGTSFILSAGDQVETSTSESQYVGFFTPTQFTSLPLAPAIGNHDNNVLYSRHFNSPNESTTYGTTNAGGDYWFTYGKTLYMVLNSNNTSAATHDGFLGQAIAANSGKDIRWKVVMFHHSIYSSASHTYDSDIIGRRNTWTPVFDKYDIDMVFAGHDHCYTRSYQLLGGEPQMDQTVDSQGRVVNPTGTLYITANSGSGSKYYNLQAVPETYAAVRQQLRTPTYSNIEISDDTFTISTYRSDNGEKVDTYSIYKTIAAPVVTSVTPASGPEAGGTEVTIKGSGFTGVKAVSFGIVPAASFNFVNDTTVTAVSPAGNDTVDIAVATYGGTSETGAATRFMYMNAGLSTTLTGPDKAKVGDTITLSLKLNGAKDISAQDLVLDYDQASFEFVGAAAEEGLTVWGTQDNGDSVEIILASDGADNAVTGNIKVLDLTFKAKALKAASVFALTKAELADLSGKITNAGLSSKTVTMVDKQALIRLIDDVEDALNSAVEGVDIGQYPTGSKARLEAAVNDARDVLEDNSATQAEVDEAVSDLTAAFEAFKRLVITSSTGDFNNNGRIDTGDLGAAAGYYGAKIGDSNWTEASRYDIDGDGSIGIYEMAFIVLKMLGR